MSKRTSITTTTPSNTSKQLTDIKQIIANNILIPPPTPFQSLITRANYHHYNVYIDNYIPYNILTLNALLSNGKCRTVATFKDFLIQDDQTEFLKRSYNHFESKIRIKKLIEFYITTSVIFPNYTPLYESKYIYRNVIQKQKVIDEQQQYEEQKEFGTLHLTTSKNDTKIINDHVYGDIINQSNSIITKMLCIVKDDNNNDNNDSSNTDIEQLITTITKYENSNNNTNNNSTNRSINVNKKRLTLKVNNTLQQQRNHYNHALHQHTKTSLISPNQMNLSSIKHKIKLNSINTQQQKHQQHHHAHSPLTLLSSPYNTNTSKHFQSLSFKSLSPLNKPPSHKHILSIKLNNNNNVQSRNTVHHHEHLQHNNFHTATNAQLSQLTMPKIETVRSNSRRKCVHVVNGVNHFNSPTIGGSARKSKCFIKRTGITMSNGNGNGNYSSRVHIGGFTRCDTDKQVKIIERRYKCDVNVNNIKVNVVK
jgi:hypothetical protein